MLSPLRSQRITPWLPERIRFRPPPIKEPHMEQVWWFNCFVVFVILIDSLVVGVETDTPRGEGWDNNFDFWLFDLTCGGVFFVEMIVRMHAKRWEYFADSWNMYDFICVCWGVTTVAQPFMDTTGTGSFNFRLLKAMKSVRLCRLLRVGRLIRGLKFVEGLWLLVAGFQRTVWAALYIMFFCVILAYFFGCTLVLMLDGAIRDETWPDRPLYFGSVFQGTLTVMQILTFDEWAPLMREGIMKSQVACIVVFIAIFIGAFGVLNLMLGVMVGGIRTIVDKTRCKTKVFLQHLDASVVKGLVNDWKEFEAKNPGELDEDEFNQLISNPTICLKMRMLGIKNEDASSIFKLMDIDCSGTVTPEEFMSGLEKMKGPAMGKDIVRVIGTAQKCAWRSRKYVERVRLLSDRADVMQRRLNRMGFGILKSLDHLSEIRKSSALVAHNGAIRQRFTHDLHTRIVDFPQMM